MDPSVMGMKKPEDQTKRNEGFRFQLPIYIYISHIRSMEIDCVSISIPHKKSTKWSTVPRLTCSYRSMNV